MVGFLTAEWLERLAAEAAAHPQLGQATGDVRVTVGHRVRGGPRGEVAYRVRFDRGTVEVAPGTDGADVVIAEDYETAVALSRGELTPARALAEGRLGVTGQLGLLARHQAAFALLGDVFAGLRAATRY